MSIIGVRIQFRRDTAANWTSANPILLQGEQGVETDTGKTKMGDGATVWTSLGYYFPVLDGSGKVPITNLPISSTALVLPTTGKPASGTGQDGDQALDRSSKVVYAKSSGVWDSGASVGPPIDSTKQGTFGWSVDPTTATNNITQTSGTLYLVRITALLSGTVGNIGFGTVTVGSTLTSGGNWVGLYDTGQITGTNTLTLLAQSADQTTNFGTVTAAYKVAITGTNSHTAAVTAGQDYYAAFLSTGSVGVKNISAGNLFGMPNFGFAGVTQFRAAHLGAVGLTLPTAVSSTLTQDASTLVAVLLP